MEPVSFLLLGCAALCIGLLRHAWRCERRSAVLAAQLKDELLRVREARKQADSLLQIAQAQTLTETLVDGGTSTVRAVHKGIASIPFGILEAIPSTSLKTKAVRLTHDAIADRIYGAISGANRLLGAAARKAIQQSADVKEKPPSN